MLLPWFSVMAFCQTIVKSSSINAVDYQNKSNGPGGSGTHDLSSEAITI